LRSNGLLDDLLVYWPCGGRSTRGDNKKLEGVGMQNLFQKDDFCAGPVMVLLGAGVTLNSTAYDLGRFTHMGVTGVGSHTARLP
jgi:hypothetical protein